MKRRAFLTTAATLAIGALAATTVLAHGTGPGSAQGPMGQGYMGQGYMGQGYMGQGHRGQGYQGHMGRGYQGQGHMGQGFKGKGPGAEDCPYGQGQTLDEPLTVDDVRAWMEKRLEWRGNDRLKVGKVEQVDDQTIIAEIVTVDDSLVQRIQFDPATGRHGPAQ